MKVTAGWEHAGKGGVTMPGKGKNIERDYKTDEGKANERGAAVLGLTGSLPTHATIIDQFFDFQK